MKKHTLKGTLVASAVASLFAVTGCVSTQPNLNMSSKPFKCEGGNSCKAQSSCKTATHDCSGKGTCKGTGWVMTKDQAECESLKAKNNG